MYICVVYKNRKSAVWCLVNGDATLLACCSRTRTTVMAVRDAFGSKNLPGQIFLTGDQFKYAPEKRLNGQSEVFYFTANENSEIITNCALTKAVSMLKNKDKIICLPFV